ncbi:hypothetical protein PG999_000277 [Apiospora kogelbergensis]|uniref:Uncharacterized protein n=2 Tax=Apiospora kogelbergensis TaxID=1337665 RepID=A0AAW0RBC8_9PEZI
MISPRTLITTVLALASMVSANPLSDVDDLAIPEVSSSNNADAGASELLSRAASKYACPAAMNGPGYNWPAHTFSSRQAEAALKTAERYQQRKGMSWKPKSVDYPHFYKDFEKFDFQCGKNKAEFPIQMDGKVAVAGTPDVRQVPDRIIYEYTWLKVGRNKSLKTRICGVIRHGPGNFVNCPAK